MEFWNQFLTRVKAKGQNPDVLAISYYPEWHGTPEALELNLHTMATTYPGYELEVAETSYPASGGDGTPMPNSPFPRTIQGQADAIQRVFQTANDVVDNQGNGVLVWEPAGWQTMFRAVPGLANTWEPHASINVYNASRAKHVLEDTVYRTTAVGARPMLPSHHPDAHHRDQADRRRPRSLAGVATRSNRRARSGHRHRHDQQGTGESRHRRGRSHFRPVTTARRP